MGRAFVLERALEGMEETLSVLGRPEEVGRLFQTPQFVGRNQRHVFMAASSDDDRFLSVFGNLQDSGEILSGVAI